MKTYVLVHGAWHGAWSYEDTKHILEQSGARVVSFDLPGHGKDKTPVPGVTMEAYVRKVKEELDKLDSPVTLVGHSLSGFVVSQVAEDLPDKIEQLIFIAAMVPYQGKSMFDIVNEDADSALLKNLIFADDKSWATVNEDTLKKVVYNQASQQQIEAAAPHLVRQATQPFFATVATTAAAFGRVHKSYIVCEKDRILSAAAQRRLVDIAHCIQSVSIPTGHVPHVENPRALAEAIMTLSHTRDTQHTTENGVNRTYLSITLDVSAENRTGAANVYKRYRKPFLETVKGARSKELLVRDEDVVVLHGFDSTENAQNYLTSELFTKDVVAGLSPYLNSGPVVEIYSVL